MAERMTMTFDLGKPGQRNTRTEHTSHILVILSNLRGHGNDASIYEPILPRRVDIESLDALMAKLQPALRKPWTQDDHVPALLFDRLECFHPDHLLRELPSADSWPEYDVSNTPSTAHADSSADSQAASESDQQTLSRLLGNQPLGMSAPSASGAGKTRRQQTLIDSVVQKLTERVSSDTVPDADHPNTESDHRYQSAALRRLLHDPEFQQLEARWRSLDWLLRNNPFDTECPVYAVDFPEFGGNPDGAQFDAVFESLYQSLTQLDPSENQLILIFDKGFKCSEPDIALLEKLGQIAQPLGALLIGAADASFSEIEEDSESGRMWQAFRSQDAARNILLTLPRLLLRLPYGRRYEPIEDFDFEEYENPGNTSDLLWGNPAYALSLILLSEALQERTFEERRFTDWPSFAYPQDGETVFQPATEFLYTEKDLQRLLSHGLVPALGSRRQNSVQFPWLQTLKDD